MDQSQSPKGGRSATLPLKYSSQSLWELTQLCLHTPRYGYDGQDVTDRAVRSGVPEIHPLRLPYMTTEFSSAVDLDWRHVMLDLMDVIRQKYEAQLARNGRHHDKADIGLEILHRFIHPLLWREAQGAKTTQAVATMMLDQACGKIPPSITQIYPDELDSTPGWFAWSWPLKLEQLPAIDSIFEQHILLVDYMPYLPADAAKTFDIWKNAEIGLNFFAAGQEAVYDWLRTAAPKMGELAAYLTKFVTCCRQGRLPSDKAWRFLKKIMDLFSVLFDIPGQPGDWALSLFYYDQYRNKSPNFSWDPSAPYSTGKATPYTGALEPMISKIQEPGVKSRLSRKLSTDVNVRIPARIHDRLLRQDMTKIAERLAAENEIPSLYKVDSGYFYAKSSRGEAQGEEKVMTFSSEAADNSPHYDAGGTKRGKSFGSRPLDGASLVTDADIKAWELEGVPGEGE